MAFVQPRLNISHKNSFSLNAIRNNFLRCAVKPHKFPIRYEFRFSQLVTFMIYRFIFCFECRYNPETLIFGITMSDFSKLMNLYWFIRFHRRNKSTKRRYYRYVAAEKKRLLEAGVDPEELRLLCRSLSTRWNIHAEKRLKTYRAKMINNFEKPDNSSPTNCV